MLMLTLLAANASTDAHLLGSDLKRYDTYGAKLMKLLALFLAMPDAFLLLDARTCSLFYAAGLH